MRWRELGAETRRALDLRPGEVRGAQVSAPPGSRLVFAWGVLRAAPGVGRARLSLRAGGRVVYSGEAPAKPRGAQWQKASVSVGDVSGLRLEFIAEHLEGAGPAEVGAEPWIALAEPRLYAPGQGNAAPRRLIWISVDALRADHLGLYGYGRRTSPHLDARGSRLAVFDEALAPASWTLPSLASQFSARYPSAHGAVQPTLKRDPRHASVFDVLAGAGFTVLGVTANGFVSRHFQTADGFDLLAFRDARADEVTRLALAALDEWPGGDLAIFVHYMDPHADYDPPPPFERFDPGYHGRIDGSNFENEARSPRDREHVVALYDGEIAYADAWIEELFRGLEARGVLAGATVVVSADHGEEFQEHGGWTHGHTLHSELLRVPLLIGVPGRPPRRVPDLVSLIDVAPTILEAFGLPAPASFEGRSLMPLLAGRPLDPRPALAETERGPRTDHRVAVRDGPFHFLLSARWEGGRPLAVDAALYDRRGDPGELRPLPGGAKAESLQRFALAWLEGARSRGTQAAPAEMPEELARELKALGYIQ
jgi:arylsulfatase A-like enzyme